MISIETSVHRQAGGFITKHYFEMVSRANRKCFLLVQCQQWLSNHVSLYQGMHFLLFNLRLYITPDFIGLFPNKLSFRRSGEIQDLLGQ